VKHEGLEPEDCTARDVGTPPRPVKVIESEHNRNAVLSFS
jgi:hypothetical protein